jgi:hypothetical protein
MYNYIQYIDIKYFLDLLFAFIFAVLVAHYSISFTVGQLWEAIIKRRKILNLILVLQRLLGALRELYMLWLYWLENPKALASGSH